jgi:hypothetical protein
LLRRLDQVLHRRVTLITAAAGFGKTTLLSAWNTDVRCWRYTFEAKEREPGGALTDRLAGTDHHGGADAGNVSAAVSHAVGDHVVLILDDVHEAPADSTGVRLIEDLCRRAPPMLHLVLVSRAEPPIPVERLRGRGQLLELDGAALAFTQSETLEVLTYALNIAAQTELTSVSRRLHELTGGWPAAVVLAAEWLRDQAPVSPGPLLERLGRPGSPLFGFLATEVFAQESSEVGELLRRMAALPRFTADLCRAVGVPMGEELLYRLTRRTMLIREQPGDPGWFTLSPLARNFLDTISPLDADELHTIRQQAADFHDHHAPRTEGRLTRAIEPGSSDLDHATGTPRGVPVRQVIPVHAALQVAGLWREGDYWTLDHVGALARLRHTKGLRYLAELLGRPGTEFHALQLIRADEGLPPRQHTTTDPDLSVGPDGLGALLDDTAKAAYRRRLEDLREDLAEAEAFHDPERAHKARYEIDALTHELARAIGLGGRDRPTGSPTERARINVTRTLRAAIAHIAATHPDLGHHLGTTIRTGTYCSYQPGPHPTVTWHL